MPAIAAFTINDGASTPVATTFSPVQRDQKTGVVWYEQTTPAPANKLSAYRIGLKTVRKNSLGRTLDDKSTVTISVWVPTLETLGTNDAGVTPPPTVAYVEEARCVFSLAERASVQERKHARMFLANFLGHANAVAFIDNLEGLYGA